ncbi:hypothetical protein RJ641_028039 [Dillenia turbinata]|uniref:C2H2-type domain-containing protein n=1 Tax=Dillenia turbinata TaxID=194707 RepID=A0AAN8ZM89_9MAGN
MEFWGVEVKAGVPFSVNVDDEKVLHLSQACLGEAKKDKGNDSICLFVKTGDKKLVLGILSADKFPQISFDLVFEKNFELSHNWKNGSSDSEDEGIQVDAINKEKEAQAKQAKPAADNANDAKPDSVAAKQKVKIVEPSKDEDDDSDEDDDESDDVSGDDMAELGKKRPFEASKTPVSDKKAKLVTPQKNDGKKGGGHTATPYPSKQGGKSAANNDRSKQQTPKSGGSFSCKSCNKSFQSDNALQSHTKAKHSAGK